MAGTTTTRRRSSKAAQDKAAREAKAAELEAQKQAEAEAPEPVAEETPDQPQGDAPESVEEAASDAGESSGFALGEVVTLPKIERSSSKGSVWTDRLNDAAEKLEAAGNPEGGAVAILVCATPRTAANTANNVRRKIREGKIGGMVAGEFEIVTRGRTILTTFTPPASEQGEGEGEESGEEAGE